MRRLLGILLLFLSAGGYAQGVYRFKRADSVKVYENSGRLPNPWAGGMNFVVAGETDLDFDGWMDLIFFDKSGNKVVPFLNLGTPNTVSYRYAPEYRKNFPVMKEWMVLTDYNRDGKTDIFTYYSGGAKVYLNTGTAATGARFTETFPLIVSDYGSVTTSIFVPSTDIPGIADLDLDGDLDFLSFDVFGGCVDYHKNLSMELYGHADSLKYKLMDRNWGKFMEDGFTNSVDLHQDCERSGPRHAGSTFLLLDVNGDRIKDLLLGDINYNNLVLLINGGTLATADMVEAQVNFPVNFGGSPNVNIPVFPAASYIDLDNDGKKDLLASPTADGRSDNAKGIWYYKNTGFDSLPNLQLAQKGFLQNTMIELGEGAYPQFVDFDGDNLKDIVVGNYGYYLGNSNYDGRLRAYRNTGTATQPEYTFYSADFGNLSSAGLDGLTPTFGDLDGDGDLDLVVGESNGRLHYYKNTAGPGAAAQYTLQAANFSGIQEPQYSAPCLFDLNEDGKLDLLVGSRNGKLNYYQNTGTVQSPQFGSVPTIAGIGGVNVVDQTLSFYGFCTPFVFADANNFQLFCGSYSGRIFHYKNLKGNLNGNWELVTSVTDSLVYEGYRTAPSVADIDNDGKYDMILGNYSGGLALFTGLIINNSVGESNLPEVDAAVYPNPFTEMLEIRMTGTPGTVEFTLYDMNGRALMRQKWTGSVQQTVDVSALPAGMYMATMKQAGFAPRVQKLVKTAYSE